MRTLVAALVAAAAAGGIAYAAIPDAAGVYHGCIHKNTGALRVIDSASQQCNAASERAITFNQQGPAGISPSVAQLASGDSHCAAGGAAITDAAGSTAYVCNGSDGADGQDGDSFDGTFTSPNGQYSLSVTDAGILLTSSLGAQVRIDGKLVTASAPEMLSLFGQDIRMSASREMQQFSGTDFVVTAARGLGLTVGTDYGLNVGRDATATVGRNLAASVGADATVDVGQNVAASVGGDATVDISRSLDLVTAVGASFDFGANATFHSGGNTSFSGSQIRLNAGSSCSRVARVGDSVSPTNITTGSLTVCAGG
jgi:hypothetical protein